MPLNIGGGNALCQNLDNWLTTRGGGPGRDDFHLAIHVAVETHTLPIGRALNARSNPPVKHELIHGRVALFSSRLNGPNKMPCLLLAALTDISYDETRALTVTSVSRLRLSRVWWHSSTRLAVAVHGADEAGWRPVPKAIGVHAGCTQDAWLASVAARQARIGLARPRSVTDPLLSRRQRVLALPSTFRKL